MKKFGSNMIEVRSRGAIVLLITPNNSDAFKCKSDEVFKIPESNSTFARLLTIILAQLLAYYCAIQKEFDPDKTRNLAKSVIVE